ncbi:MAG: hypothetical protein K8T10_08985 [Candidatus Eremiobacteraeota bacterium]|nr:hypothetical protein [Candidatus Eremiobacteraeota bacterium]
MLKKTHFIICTSMIILTGILGLCVFFSLPELALNATAILLLIVVVTRILSEATLWISKLFNKTQKEDKLDRLLCDLSECRPLFLTAVVVWFVIAMAKFIVPKGNVFYLKLMEKIPTAVLMAIALIVILDLISISVFKTRQIPGLKMLRRNGNSVNGVNGK